MKAPTCKAKNSPELQRETKERPIHLKTAPIQEKPESQKSTSSKERGEAWEEDLIYETFAIYRSLWNFQKTTTTTILEVI